MATMVHVTPNVKLANELISAVQMLRGGISALKKVYPIMAESIGVSQAELVANFGFATTDEAQAFFDRANAFLAAYDDGLNAEMTKIRDMINAFV